MMAEKPYPLVWAESETLMKLFFFANQDQNYAKMTIFSRIFENKSDFLVESNKTDGREGNLTEPYFMDNMFL